MKQTIELWKIPINFTNSVPPGAFAIDRVRGQLNWLFRVPADISCEVWDNFEASMNVFHETVKTEKVDGFIYLESLDENEPSHLLPLQMKYSCVDGTIT